MKDWADFHPFVLTDVQGCPNPLLNQQLRLAAREFCEATGGWKEWLDAMTLDGTLTRFDFDTTSGQEVVRVSRATLNGEDIAVKAGRDLPEDWQEATPAAGEDDTLYVLDTDEFVLLPTPTAGDVLRIEAELRPSLDADQSPDVLVNKHADVIASNAKARLLAMPRRPWSDLGSAAYHRGQYEQRATREANVAVIHRRPMRTGRTVL